MNWSKEGNESTIVFDFPAPVAEHPRIGSDGESEEASAASDDLTSPARIRPSLDVSYGVKLRSKNQRRHSEVGTQLLDL